MVAAMTTGVARTNSVDASGSHGPALSEDVESTGATPGTFVRGDFDVRRLAANCAKAYIGPPCEQFTSAERKRAD